MNDNTPRKNSPEEVDLGQFFAAIGRAFERFFDFLLSILKWLFSIIIYTIKAVIVNFKIIVIVMLIAAIAGYVAQKFKPNLYSSTMLVRPYFDSKYQMVNNIKYYNALLSNGDYQTLSSIFELKDDEMKEVKRFAIDFGPESEVEKIQEYNEFLKTLDSTSKNKLSLEEYIENRSIFSADIFEIKVTSTKRDIFPKLEEGFSNAFTNVYSEKKKAKRDSLIELQKRNILEQLVQVDSLQNVYVQVLKTESQAQKSEVTFGAEGLSVSKDKTNTREYELLEQEMKLRNDLKKLEQQKIEEDDFFDVISSFQKTGNLEREFKDRYVIIFPIIAFILMCLFYFTQKVVKYTKEYEG